MAIRSLSKLYLVLHNNYNSDLGLALCVYLTYAMEVKIISRREYEAINRDFITRKPGIFNLFFWNSAFYQSASKYGYWWKINETGFKQRKKYLLYLSNKLKKEDASWRLPLLPSPVLPSPY